MYIFLLTFATKIISHHQLTLTQRIILFISLFVSSNTLMKFLIKFSTNMLFLVVGQNTFLLTLKRDSPHKRKPMGKKIKIKLNYVRKIKQIVIFKDQDFYDYDEIM